MPRQNAPSLSRSDRMQKLKAGQPKTITKGKRGVEIAERQFRLPRSHKQDKSVFSPLLCAYKRGWPADDKLPIGRQLNPTNSMKERTAEQSLSLFMSYNHKKSRCFNKVFKGLSCDFCSNMELFSILQVQLYFQDGEGNNRYGQPDRQANSAIPRKGRPQPGGLSRSRFAEHDRNF